MSKLTEAQATLETKKKSFDKNIEAMKKLDDSCKKLATDGTSKESKAKAAKGDEKKKLEGECNQIRSQFSTEDQKRITLRKIQEEMTKSIKTLEEQINKGLEGVADFGKSRRDYLELFNAKKGSLNTFVSEAQKFQKAAEEAAKITKTSIDGGLIVKAAEAAGTCGKMVDFAEAELKKFNAWTTEFNPKMQSQRNLAPTEYGIETADVVVHERVTTQVYETFKIIDQTRDRLDEAVEKAQAASKESDIYLSTGQENEKRYALILDEADKALAAKVKEYNDALVPTWGKAIADEGKRFTDEAALIVKGKAETVSRGLKIAEQARAAVPKAMDGLKDIVRQAGEGVTKERGRVPDTFQRALKSRVDKLAMTLMGLLQIHKSISGKYTLTITALEGLEAKAKEAASD